MESKMTIQPLTIEETTGELNEKLTGIKSKLGMLPNLLAVMAKAPTVLDTYLGNSDNLKKGSISAQVGEQIAIALAVENSCEYCLSAHTTIGRNAGLGEQDLADAQSGKANDPKAQAAVDLALELNESHGHGPETQATLQKALEAGLTEQEVLEVVTHVTQNILTNTINGLAKTDIDFPKVELNKAA